jgi:hypothetical protein
MSWCYVKQNFLRDVFGDEEGNEGNEGDVMKEFKN